MWSRYRFWDCGVLCCSILKFTCSSESCSISIFFLLVKFSFQAQKLYKKRCLSCTPPLNFSSLQWNSSAISKEIYLKWFEI